MNRVKARRCIRWPLAAVVLLAGAASAADSAGVAYRLAFDGGADSHGEIVLSFAEAGAEPTEIQSAIPKGTRENHVADRVWRSLRRALPKDQYDVDVRGGEQILITALDPARQFEIRIVRNTVRGTEVRIELLKSER